MAANGRSKSHFSILFIFSIKKAPLSKFRGFKR
ncbi:uncharacterized protein G2W53_040660 [Senna tora]|uniref:Uncharacterized protein n=1 Tax=Senna tora TaxID=362788 RepID=A0A834SE06_9FABA|nr:uncharacterized protein G2W53_040660 [Senna tora]